MFRMLGWLVIIIIAVAYFFPSDEKKENATVEINQDEMRLESATTEQKACVKTLGQGVYKDKSLSWKLDSCHVPK